MYMRLRYFRNYLRQKVGGYKGLLQNLFGWPDFLYAYLCTCNFSYEVILLLCRLL